MESLLSMSYKNYDYSLWSSIGCEIVSFASQSENLLYLVAVFDQV